MLLPILYGRRTRHEIDPGEAEAGPVCRDKPVHGDKQLPSSFRVQGTDCVTWIYYLILLTENVIT